MEIGREAVEINVGKEMRDEGKRRTGDKRERQRHAGDDIRGERERVEREKERRGREGNGKGENRWRRKRKRGREEGGEVVT